MKRFSTMLLVLPLLAAGALVLSGCGNADQAAGAPEGNSTEVAAHDEGESGHHEDDGHDHAGEEKQPHTHGQWWCGEHGIPEHICSMCSVEYAEKCKAAGDWCEEHDRAKSQCFQCDPSLAEKFAIMYRNKYPGKEPPPIGEAQP